MNLPLPDVHAVALLDDDELPRFIMHCAALIVAASTRLPLERVVVQDRDPQPVYVTQAAAAERFGLPVATLRALTRRGRVPCIKQGRNNLVQLADIETYLDTCRQTGRRIGR